MNQTKLGSLIESLVNIAIGFGINFGMNLVILPLFGFHISLTNNFIMGLLFTVVSVIRSYTIRRFFNSWLHSMSLAAAAAIKGDAK